jgi:hypothetical protein
MDVSSSTSAPQSTTQIQVMKKAQEVQAQEITNVLESATEQSKQVSAQKTGMGAGLDLTA